MNLKKFDNCSTIPKLIEEYEAYLHNGQKKFYDEKAFAEIIDHYEQEGALERALEVADHAISCLPYSYELLLKKISLLLSHKEYDRADIAIGQASTLMPNSTQVQLLTIELYILKEEYLSALGLIEAQKEWIDTQVLSHLLVLESIIYEKQEQYEQMYFCLEEALRLNPKNESALVRVMICVEFSKKFDESVDLHQEILDADPFNYRAWYNLGHAYAYLGDYFDAIEAFEYSFLINEHFEFAYRDCAEVCLEVECYEKALECYTEVQEIFESDSDLLLKIGICHLHLGHTDEALNSFVRSGMVEALQDQVFYYIGECHARKKRYVEAVKFYHKAIEIEQRREEYYLRLAQAYAKLKDYDQAKHFFSKAIETGPEEPTIWADYIIFLLQTGDDELALEISQEANYYHDDLELTLCLGAAYYANGILPKAYSLMQQVLQEWPDADVLLFGMIPTLAEDKTIKMILKTFF